MDVDYAWNDEQDGNLAVFSGLSYKYISLPFSLPPPKYFSRMEAEWIFPFPVKWILLYPSLLGVKRTNLTQNFFCSLFCERPISFRTLLICLHSEVFLVTVGSCTVFLFQLISEGVSVTCDKHTSRHFMKFLNYDVLLFSVRLLKFLSFELMVT